jgi:ferredoxin--NADP+ reductase
MSLQWISGKIVKRHVWSEGLFTISVSAPGVAPFESGQFLQVGLNLPEKHLHRPYSVASPHGDILDFFIVRVDGGELTPRLWNLGEGDTVDISAKATGGFTLSHTPDAHCIWLIATGTGLAPYIAMLRDTTIWQRYPRIVLVHGVRHCTDLAYHDELHRYRDRYPQQFRFISAVSRDAGKGCLNGRITTALENGSLEQVAEARIAPEESAIMMCGNPDMLNDLEAIFQRRGLSKHKTKTPGHYVVERYW